MRFGVSILFATLIAVAGGTTGFAAANKPRLPYTFEQNQGQAPEGVRFLARGEGYGLFLTDREAILTLVRGSGVNQLIRMSLDNSRAPETIQGVQPSDQRTNYLVGNDPKQWKTNVPHFESVRYAQVYEGVDLVYHNAAGQLEYDFVVAPGASSDLIRLRFGGVQKMTVAASGALEMHLGARTLVHQAPIAYQEVHGKRQRVKASYQLLGDNRVGFRVGKHDETLPLVIDPVVIYSTFLGGERTDTAHAVAVDPQGNTYVTGETTSGDFPAVGTAITKIQGAVPYAFVTKFNAAGDKILYSTFIGGDSNTRGLAIAVDQAGNAYLGGVTGARNFPLVNPVQATQPGLNIGYVAKLNPQGNALVFSTYIGGERNDEVRDIALDAEGNIHIVGRVTSTTFPTTSAFQPTFGGSSDGFAAVYKAPDYRLKFSTLIGAASAEEANAVAVDSQGNTYVTGFSQGPGMATTGAYQKIVASPNDAFVAKISAAGTSLDWFTYYGGRGDDQGQTIALDGSGNILVGGWATSNNLPTTADALQPAIRGDSDAFIAKFSNTGRELLYATYLGSTTTRSSITESINRLAIDSLGSVTIAGVSNGADFPTVRPIQAYGGGSSDGFVARLNASLTAIDFSTHVGGTLDDSIFGMALDSGGGVHLGGDTLSTNFPLKNAIRTTFGGAREAFVSHICDPILLPSSTRLDFFYEVGKALPEKQTVQISACAPIPFQTQVLGGFTSATPTNATTNGTITVTVNPQNKDLGTYQEQVRVTAADAVNSPISIKVVLHVTGPPPVITTAGVAHGATATGGAIAPGELVVIYGDNLGPNSLANFAVDGDGRMATSVSETRVYFDGVPAPIVYAYKGQVSVIVPYAVAGKASTKIELEYQAVRSAPITVPVTATAPGIFTANTSGTGQGSILNQDYSVNGGSNPASRGSYIAIYGTGEGQTDPGGSDGVFTGTTLPKPLAHVTVTIGGVDAPVVYAGGAPGLVAGVFQVNVKVPQEIPAGSAEVLVKVGTATSRRGVTVAVK